MPNNHTTSAKKAVKSFILGVKIFSIRQLFFSLLILSSLLTLNFIRYSFFETPKTIAESSTPTGADNPTLSLTISGSNQINYSDSSITEKSATTNIKVKTDNETGYVVNFSNQAADTTLYNSDTSSNSKITSIISDTTTLPSNTYGWSLDNTTFQPIPAITQPKDIIKTEEPTDTTGETHELHIKTKINNTLDAGTYSTNLTFSVITNNAPTRAEFMAYFNTTFRNYLDTNGINITPTRFTSHNQPQHPLLQPSPHQLQLQDTKLKHGLTSLIEPFIGIPQQKSPTSMKTLSVFLVHKIISMN